MTKAWRTTWKGITSIVAAPSRGVAVRRTLASATDAGYRPAWTEVRAVRAPEYDGWAGTLDTPRQWQCLAEEIVRRQMEDRT